MIATYHGPDTQFMRSGQAYELQDVTPEDATDFHWQVAGIPNKFFYDSKEAFQAEWTELADRTNSDAVNQINQA